MTKEMVKYLRSLMRRQWTAAGLALFLICFLYLTGTASLHAWTHNARAQVLGLQTTLGQNAVARAPRLSYAPDVSPPPVADGKAPVLFKVPTSLPVVFLTIDDGFYREPQAAHAMKDARVAATFFLVKQYVAATPRYFGDLARSTGSSIEDHTLDHKDLTTLAYADQKREICETADDFAADYGRRPQLFRPPYGSYNDDTQRAAAACGMRAVVHWHALVENGAMEYQIGNALRPGDIVLMHFTPHFVEDFNAFMQASKDAHLTPQPLDPWLANN